MLPCSTTRLARQAQQTKPTVGWLHQRLGKPAREYIEAFRRGLAEIGILEGRDVTIEYHSQNRWNGAMAFYAADSSKREMLAVALMARSLNRPVTAEVDAPNVNPDGSQGPLTMYHRLYLE